MVDKARERPCEEPVSPSIQAEIITLGIGRGDTPDFGSADNLPIDSDTAKEIAFLALQYPED